MSKLYDLARVTVTSAPGVGHLPLGPAVFGFLTFPLAGVQNADVVTYAISDSQQSEIGHGTYTTLTNILTRDVVLSSTNGGINGSPINASSSCQVFITIAAEDISVVSTVTVGTTSVAGGVSNGLLYNNAGALGNLSTGNNGVLITSGTGVPSISSTLPISLTIPSATSISTASLSVSGAQTIGTPTGGALGTGTINVSGGVYVNNVSLSAVFTSSTNGLVPASGGGTTNFLRADGTFASPITNVPAYAMLNALDYGVVGDGTTNDGPAINTFYTTASSLGAVAYLPTGLNYNIYNTVLTVPDGSTVICGPTATVSRTTDIVAAGNPYSLFNSAMVVMGNNCTWRGGILNNSAVLTTSATSNAIATGLKTFTVSAGLPVTTASFLRIWSRGTPAAKFEGSVSSYSGTTLVLNASFTGGSGTHTDWNVTYGAVYQCPMVLNGVTQTVVENVTITGNWYVGLLMAGWNASGTTLRTTQCTFRNCWPIGVQNRSIYLYGTCVDNVIDNCFMEGSTGLTDYTYNANPANTGGSTNFQQGNKVLGCRSQGAAFQGFELGDSCSYNIIANCEVNVMTNSASVGFLVQTANGNAPSLNTVIGCVARNVPGLGLEVVNANFTNVVGFTAAVCGTGASVNGGSENSLQSLMCNANTLGVIVNSGSNNTIVNGRSTGNTTNLTDNGTGTISGGLVQT